MFSMETDLEPVIESNDESESSSSDSMGNETTRLMKTDNTVKVPGYYMLNDYDEDESLGQLDSLLTEEDMTDLNFSGDYIDDLEL